MESLLEFTRKHTGTTSPMHLWGCEKCGNKFLAHLPHTQHPFDVGRDGLKPGRCPWCWQEDAEIIYLILGSQWIDVAPEMEG